MSRILSLKDFLIKEDITNTPSSYIRQALKKIKNKIEKTFDENSPSSSLRGVSIDSIEMSQYSSLYDTLTVKYSEEDFTYTMIVSIDLSDAVPEQTNDDELKNFSINDIKKCYVKLKKYDYDNFDLLSEVDRNLEIKDMFDNPFEIMSELKMEADEAYGESSGDDDFEIET